MTDTDKIRAAQRQAIKDAPSFAAAVYAADKAIVKAQAANLTAAEVCTAGEAAFAAAKAAYHPRGNQ